MGHFWKTTPQQRAEIIERYRGGERPVEIAPHYKITPSYVSVLAKKAGCQPHGVYVPDPVKKAIAKG